MVDQPYNKDEYKEAVEKRDAIFMRLFDKEKSIMTAEGGITNNATDPYVINTSSIATLLIHAAGRWCEYYASDFIISWDSVREIIKEICASEDEEIQPRIVVFGFRRSGVDGNAYVYSNMTQYENGYIDNYYAKIYAVKISCTRSEDCPNYKTVCVDIRDIKSGVDMEVYHMHTMSPM